MMLKKVDASAPSEGEAAHTYSSEWSAVRCLMSWKSARETKREEKPAAGDDMRLA